MQKFFVSYKENDRVKNLVTDKHPVEFLIQSKKEGQDISLLFWEKVPEEIETSLLEKPIQNKTKVLTLYIDGVDWMHELGEAADGTKFYPSLDCLKQYSKCWQECGVVKVTATFENPEWVEKCNI